MKTVGIIDALGPETTADFYLQIVKKYRQREKQRYPAIAINTLPIPFDLEQQVVQFNQNESKLLPYLTEGAQRLEQAGADFCVMPCNTVHVFLEQVRASVSIPVLSIIEETAARITVDCIEAVGLLGTTRTIQSRLYADQLETQGVRVLTPSTDEQTEVSRIIMNILQGEKTMADGAYLRGVMEAFKQQGAQGVVLGCTAFPLLMTQADIDLPLYDSLSILADAAATEMAITVSLTATDAVQAPPIVAKPATTTGL